MDDFDDRIWQLSEDARIIAGPLWRLPAFTCRPLAGSSAAAPCAATSCHSPVVKPAARLIFTPWVFGKSTRSVMHA